jgi:hypothetical protein
MGKNWNTYKVLVRKLKERDQSEDRGVNGKLLKCILKIKNGIAWSGFSIWTSGGNYERGTEHSGAMKRGEFLASLKTSSF